MSTIRKTIPTTKAKPLSSVQEATKAKRQLQTERMTHPLAKTLGAKIKEMRIARNLSQEQLAGEGEMDRTAISLIELGKANPTIFLLSVLARIFGVTLSELLEPISAEMNLQPTWQNKKAIKRRANRSTPERKPAPPRRLR